MSSVWPPRVTTTCHCVLWEPPSGKGSTTGEAEISVGIINFDGAEAPTFEVFSHSGTRCTVFALPL